MAALSVKSSFFRGLGRGRDLLTDDHRVLNSVSIVSMVAAVSRIFGATGLSLGLASVRDIL